MTSDPDMRRRRSAGSIEWIDRLKAPAPYVAVLLITGYLFYRSTQFGFEAQDGRIGPDIWPKAILGLAMLTCVYGIFKSLRSRDRRHEISGVLDSVVEDISAEAPADDAEAPPVQRSYPHLLMAGAAMTVAYALLVDKLGFFLCTALFIAGFAWVGRYRRPGVIVATALFGSFAFMFMFMKIVYISLPLGVGPFERLSTLLMRLMGIH